MGDGAFVGTLGNAESAPAPAIWGSPAEPRSSTIKSNSRPRAGMVISTRARKIRRLAPKEMTAHANSSSSVLASFRSKVPKPSVNQS